MFSVVGQRNCRRVIPRNNKGRRDTLQYKWEFLFTTAVGGEGLAITRVNFFTSQLPQLFISPDVEETLRENPRRAYQLRDDYGLPCGNWMDNWNDSYQGHGSYGARSRQTQTRSTAAPSFLPSFPSLFHRLFGCAKRAFPPAQAS